MFMGGYGNQQVAVDKSRVSQAKVHLAFSKGEGGFLGKDSEGIDDAHAAYKLITVDVKVEVEFPSNRAG